MQLRKIRERAEQCTTWICASCQLLNIAHINDGTNVMRQVWEQHKTNLLADCGYRNDVMSSSNCSFLTNWKFSCVSMSTTGRGSLSSVIAKGYQSTCTKCKCWCWKYTRANSKQWPAKLHCCYPPSGGCMHMLATISRSRSLFFHKSEAIALPAKKIRGQEINRESLGNLARTVISAQWMLIGQEEESETRKCAILSLIQVWKNTWKERMAAGRM